MTPDDGSHLPHGIAPSYICHKLCTFSECMWWIGCENSYINIVMVMIFLRYFRNFLKI